MYVDVSPRFIFLPAQLAIQEYVQTSSIPLSSSISSPTTTQALGSRKSPLLSARHKLSAPSAYVMSIPSANPRFTISQIHNPSRVSTQVTLTLQTPLLSIPRPLGENISPRPRRPSVRARTRSREHISAVTTFDQHDLFKSSDHVPTFTPLSHVAELLRTFTTRSCAVTFASTTPLLPPERALSTTVR